MTVILVDSSFMYAVYNRYDKRHLLAVEYARQLQGIRVLVPDVVVPEVCYLFLRDYGHYKVVEFMDVFRRAEVESVSLTMDDLNRIYGVMAYYREAKLDVVDCCIVAIAERLNVTRIATFDRRDFSMIRPLHADYFELLPNP